MSSYSGHGRITRKAIEELGSKCRQHSLAGNVRVMDLTGFNKAVDARAVISLGHWHSWNQNYHFMRRFDGQSPMEAYNNSVKWIRSNTLSAAKLMWKRINDDLDNTPALHARRPTSCKVYPLKKTGTKAFINGGEVINRRNAHWMNLGYAIHALQDSFSTGHVLRGKPGNEKSTA